MTALALRSKSGLALALLIAVLGLLWWAPITDPLMIDLSSPLSAPSAQHWFGTDQYGRDLFSRTLAAAPLSFFICVTATLIALAIGAILGGAAGYRGGAIDRILSAIADSLAALPALLLALLIMAIVGPSASGIAVAVGFASVPSVARVVRGTVLSIRQKEFIEASRMLGASHASVFVRHILPNCITPLTVLATALASQALLIESALSFLGLGAPPPAATWGGLLADSRQFIASAPWLGIFPGLALTTAVLSLNLLGDRLRERFDKGVRR